MKSRLFLCVSLFFYGTSVYAAPIKTGQILFIHHDFTELKERPSPESPVIARLRVNTEVEAMEDGSRWVRVTEIRSERRVTGYIRSEALSTTPLSYEHAMQRAGQALAKNPSEAAAWAERALAISGGGPRQYLPTLQFLEKAYRRAGRIKRAQRIERTITDLQSGQKDLWIAACLPKKRGQEPAGAGHRVVVLAHSTRDGLRSLTPGGAAGQAQVLAELRSALPLLGAESWFSITPTGSKETLSGTPFLNASIINAEGTGSFTDTPKIVLGSCDDPGTLYSNRPLTPVRWGDSEPEEKVLMERALGRYFQPGFDFTTRPPLAARYSTLIMNEKVTLHQGLLRHAHPHLEKTIGIWGLFRTQSPAPLYQIGKYESPDSYSSVYAVTWAQSDWGPTMRFAVLPYRLHSQGGGAGERVMVLRFGPDEESQSVDCVIDIAQGQPTD